MTLEFFVGIFLGICIMLLLFVITQTIVILRWSTDMYTIQEYTNGTVELLCLNCSTHTLLPSNINHIEYCPHCGKPVRKVLSYDSV